ncbi:MAG: hypothetical protein HFI72_01995 [Peptococcaceae bacterium]|jgi:hypothetical protein|nr:hypothetical protein [Peptococcaceae bacterium]
MNKETDRAQCFDEILKDAFVNTAKDHIFFANKEEAAAFTDRIMEEVIKAEMMAEGPEKNMPLQEKEPEDIVTPLYCSASQNQKLIKENKPMKSKKC